jgi:uncharacterized protein (TIGR00266 family)
MEHSVKITGKIHPHADREMAMASFARMAKIGEEQALSLFSRAPVAIKRGLSPEMAEKFLAALEKIGVMAEIDPPLQPVPVDVAEAVEVVETVDVVETVESVEEPEEVQHEEPQPGFPFRIEGRPDFAFLTVQIPAGETLKVEASAMATMDTNLRMKTKLRGGFGRFLTGESIFVNEFTAEGVPGEIGIAPGSPGDMMHLYLDGNTIYLQNSAFVAAGMEVTLETKWQGLVKGFFSGESLFLIRASGRGDLWCNTYGALIEIDIREDYVVDTGNIVAFTDGLEYEVTKVGGYKSLFLSGEGFVCRFRGEGKVWVQTRGVSAFAWWLHPFRPIKKRFG